MKTPHVIKMSDKLDSSLDEILATRRVGNARNARKDLRRKAPAGGVKKTQKPVKGAVKPGPIASAPEQLASKILIENLPGDVNEQMVKRIIQTKPPADVMGTIEHQRAQYQSQDNTKVQCYDVINEHVFCAIRQEFLNQRNAWYFTRQAISSSVALGTLFGDVSCPNRFSDAGFSIRVEYFKGAKLGTKSVEISYGPNGVSRGRATVAFYRPADAATAMKALDGVSIDKGPILKVNLVVDAKSFVSTLPSGAPKKLNDRISAPKPQPKSAAINNNKAGNAKGKAQPKKKDGKKPARPARPAKKTAEELDLEMADYWESGNGATVDNSNNQANMDTGDQAANAAAQPAANGDANMDDEILV
ncbi:hypothetical protein CJF31_00011920 [Rutstroemia sp. NJR-2017a BVV2]|nr:hypothetical protein CJF31_00011920 [Rutstroemia sp. NJR-2017a BVV2]